MIDALHIRSSTIIDLKCYKDDITYIERLKPQHNIVNKGSSYCDFTLSELVDIAKALKSFTLIETFDVRYHDAIAKIKQESFVGFYMPGTENGRFSTASLIAISTSDALYMFDLVKFGKIEKSMKSILESNVPKKIIHDASYVADILQTKYQINLNGVFDTLVGKFPY